MKGTDWRAALGQLAEQEGMDLKAVEPDEPQPAKFKKQHLRIKVEKRGAAQKKATLIYDYDGSDEEIAEFATQLRQKLSTGGSARGGEILLQGDVAEKVAQIIEQMGHKVKVQK